MSIFNFFKRLANKQATSQPKYVSDYPAYFPKTTGTSGTAFACVDRIASEFASLNYHIYTKTKQKVERHKFLATLKQPNLEDRHYNFFYQSATDYFYNGGCFWLKTKNAFDEVVSLFRLQANSVSIQRDFDTNERIFVYNGKTYTNDEIVYIPSRFNYSTLYGGQSIFKAAQETFNTADSLETFTQSSFTNGVIGKRVVIDVSGAFPDLTKEQAREIKDNWQKEYGGLENAGRPILKKKGFEYENLEGTSATNNQSAELFENRKFQEHEIAKIFGVPRELLSADIGAGNLENIFTLFAEFAVRPMATQFEEAINSMLEEDKYFFEFDYNGITKVSMSQRMSAYKDQFLNGWASVNEIRARENLEPIEAGDYHFIAANLMPLLESNIAAYMAKQKLALQQLQNGNTTPASDTNTDEGDIDSNDDKNNGDHFAGGDDKQ